MEALRHALMIGRLRYGAGGVTHDDVSALGDRRVRRDASAATTSAGSRPGCRPISPFSPSTNRASPGAHDPLAALVLCGAHRADRVMVGGPWRVIDGQPVGIDLAKLIADQRQAARLFE